MRKRRSWLLRPQVTSDRYTNNRKFVLPFSIDTTVTAGHGLLILKASRSHTTTHHSRYRSSGRVIGPSQRPLPDNTHNRQTSMPPVGFEPTIPASERPQTHALDRAATGTGWKFLHTYIIRSSSHSEASCYIAFTGDNVKNTRSCASTPSICLLDLDKNKFTWRRLTPWSRILLEILCYWTKKMFTPLWNIRFITQLIFIPHTYFVRQ